MVSFTAAALVTVGEVPVFQYPMSELLIPEGSVVENFVQFMQQEHVMRWLQTQAQRHLDAAKSDAPGDNQRTEKHLTFLLKQTNHFLGAPPAVH
jgi:hypothetical protein